MSISRSDKFYTIEEATEMLGVSEREIMNMITLKKLPAVKMEQSIKIKEEDMEKFLDSLGEESAEDKNTGEVGAGEEEKQEEIKENYEDNTAQLIKLYRELLRKKQELEEDINYLQCKYDEFKSRIKKIISEEFNLFLKKIDEENLRESDMVPGNDFNDDLSIDYDIDRVKDNEKNSYDDKGEIFSEDNGRGKENPLSEKEDNIKLEGNEDDDS
jgi:excisionase family DNA binding protein